MPKVFFSFGAPKLGIKLWMAKNFMFYTLNPGVKLWSVEQKKGLLKNNDLILVTISTVLNLPLLVSA